MSTHRESAQAPIHSRSEASGPVDERFPLSVARGRISTKDTTNRSAPNQGAGTPIGGLAGRAKDTTNLMNTIDATPDNRPAPTCPTCGERATGTGTTIDKGVITANCICEAGHLWLTRWMAA